MTKSCSLIIVEKTATLKSLNIKDFVLDDLYKKCGFKKSDGFEKQVEWKLKTGGSKYILEVYGKLDGRGNNENKYDFPPPIDNILFFGSCAIVAKKMNEGIWEYTNLSLELWEKMYDKLFGGFEDLSATALEDENEEDELENISKEKKTKSGYLKDGFVVDDSDSEFEESIEEEVAVEVEDMGSELSEDHYDYDTDKET